MRSFSRLTLAFVLSLSAVASASAQCWTQSLWDATRGVPAPANGGAYPLINAPPTTTFPATDVMRLESAVSGFVSTAYTTNLLPPPPPLVFIEAEFRVESGVSSVSIFGPVRFNAVLGPGYQVIANFDTDRVFLWAAGGANIVATAQIDTTVFATWRLEMEPQAHVARLYRNGALILTGNGILGNNAGFRNIEWGNVAAWVAPSAVSEWKWLRHNASDVDDLGTYCVAKPNSWGCTPRMGWTGRPEWSAPGDFTITCQDVPVNVFGILGWSVDRNAVVPFAGGFRCIGGTAIYRTPIQAAGTNPQAGACALGGGVLSYRFSDEYGVHPALAVGTTVFAQWFYRDPAAGGWGLSDGLKFTICP